MRRLRKPALVAWVWLTAAMNLFAGVPHFVCQCPTEAADSCRSAPAADSCCCRGGSCGEPRAASCCARKKSPVSPHFSSHYAANDRAEATSVSGRSGAHSSIQPRACTRGLATGQPAVLSQSKRVAGEGSFVEALVSQSISFASSLLPSQRSRNLSSSDRSAPSTDLITILQRLTI